MTGASLLPSTVWGCRVMFRLNMDGLTTSGVGLPRATTAYWTAIEQTRCEYAGIRGELDR